MELTVSIYTLLSPLVNLSQVLRKNLLRVTCILFLGKEVVLHACAKISMMQCESDSQYDIHYHAHACAYERGLTRGSHIQLKFERYEGAETCWEHFGTNLELLL